MEASVKSKQELLTHYEWKVDPETGEFFYDVEDIEKDLGRMLWRLRQDREALADAIKEADKMIAHFRAAKDEIIERHQRKEDYFLSRCRQHMENVGKDKLSCPGVGKVKYRKQQPELDTSGFDSLDPDSQENLADHMPTLFRCSIDPDKNAIKAVLKDGKVVSGFALVDREPKIVFEEEK